MQAAPGVRAGPLGMLADGTAITVWSTTALRATVGPPGAAFGPAEPIAPAETPPGRDSPRPRLPRPGRRRPRRTVDVAVIAGLLALALALALGAATLRRRTG